MRRHTALALRVLGIGLLLSASVAFGCASSKTGDGGQSTISTGDVATMADSAPKSDESLSGRAQGGESQASVSGGSPVAAPQDTLVVSTVGLNVEVKDLDAAVAAIRGLATKYGASIANLSMSAGDGSVPGPQPLDGSSAEYRTPTPGGATITLRVPAAKLATATEEIASLGSVISQTSSQDDVTQQHVDMKARLKNLQAQESRLRTFFLKATRVSEMLAIETELARVRGDIESMQAQITYLERQAAMATLTVSLSQPGALVSPAGGGWGFTEAVRDGVRAAASVLRGMITTVIAFSPLIVLGLVLFIVIRAMVVRRRNRRAAAALEPSEPVQPASAQEQEPSTRS